MSIPGNECSLKQHPALVLKMDGGNYKTYFWMPNNKFAPSDFVATPSFSLFSYTFVLQNSLNTHVYHKISRAESRIGLLLPQSIKTAAAARLFATLHNSIPCAPPQLSAVSRYLAATLSRVLSLSHTHVHSMCLPRKHNTCRPQTCTQNSQSLSGAPPQNKSPSSTHNNKHNRTRTRMRAHTHVNSHKL